MEVTLDRSVNNLNEMMPILNSILPHKCLRYAQLLEIWQGRIWEHCTGGEATLSLSRISRDFEVVKVVRGVSNAVFIYY